MHFLATAIIQNTYIIAQLCATNNAVVTEQHPLAVKHSLVGNQFHLGHKQTHTLVAQVKLRGHVGVYLEIAR